MDKTTTTYALGVDFGTLSVRAVLVNLWDGQIVASETCAYAHGILDPTGLAYGAINGSCALQEPDDYLKAMQETVTRAIESSGLAPEQISCIGVDFTSCTMLPIDKNGIPLCRQEQWKNHKNAYAKLWKHHGAQRFADRINAVLEEKNLQYSPVFGGRISCELMIPKIMETLTEDPELYTAAATFVEAGDWITQTLTHTANRSISMAGYKAWYDNDNRYPETDLMASFDSALKNVVTDKLAGNICPVGTSVGTLSTEWADILGLCPGLPVAPAIIDSHAGVPGCGVSRPDQAMLVLGTSSVLISLGSEKYSEKGIYGNVRDAIVPGFYALESGLACVGDLFEWFLTHMVPYQYYEKSREQGISLHELLSKKASELPVWEDDLLVLEWWNGNKTPYVDGNLKGMIYGLTLATRPEEIYRALIQATAFGTRQILDLYEKQGIQIHEILCSGGIASKNPLVMQIYADILGKNLKVTSSTQTAALGSAIYASLCLEADQGGYDSYEDAVTHMVPDEGTCYLPNAEYMEIYDRMYERYKKFAELVHRTA